MARSGAAQPLWSQGRWEWTAPPGTTIAAALSRIARACGIRSSSPASRRAPTAHLGSRADARERAADDCADRSRARRWHRASGGIGIVALRPPRGGRRGRRQWDDYVTLVRLDVTVDDPTPPTLGLGRRRRPARRRLASTATSARRSPSPTPSPASARPGSRAAASRRRGSRRARVRSISPGSPSAQPTLCLSAAALGDGLHSGTADATDVSTGQAAPLAVLGRDRRARRRLRRSSRPPPSHPTPGRSVTLNVTDNMSGVASVLAQIDGTTVPLDLVGGARQRHAVGRARLRRAHAGLVGRRRRRQPYKRDRRLRGAGSTAPVFGAPQPSNGAVLADGDVLRRRGRCRGRRFRSRSRLDSPHARRGARRPRLAGRRRRRTASRRAGSQPARINSRSTSRIERATPTASSGL